MPDTIKIKILCILVVGCSVLLSCKTNTASKCGPCPEYAQIEPSVNVRIVDKNTDNDLFLSPNSPYKLSDLKITSSVSGSNVTAYVDSTQNDNRSLRIFTYPTQTITLKLGNLSADSIHVVIKQDSPKCCPVLKVSAITLNTASVCSPCTYNESITIKK